MQHRKIVIVGGGPIGLAMALLLAKSGQAVTLFDVGNSKQNDGRVLALSYASGQVLKELGAWPDNLATSINQVHISHDGLGISKILAADVNLEDLGYTIKYADICAKLKEQVEKTATCECITAVVKEVIPSPNYATIDYVIAKEHKFVTADLAILAEGGMAKVSTREYENYDYSQTAIITKLTTQKKPAGIAYERFENGSSLVLLPHGAEYILTWSLDNVIAKQILADNDILRDKLFSMPFMERFGKFSISGSIHSFPLKLQFAKNRVLDNVVLIGNSAQTVHPVSAQGMNLGLRDALTLSEVIFNASGYSKNGVRSWQSILDKYNRLRQTDAQGVINFTHGLAKFLHLDVPLLKHIRGAGIIALSNCKSLQNKIANTLIFGS